MWNPLRSETDLLSERFNGVHGSKRTCHAMKWSWRVRFPPEAFYFLLNLYRSANSSSRTVL